MTFCVTFMTFLSSGGRRPVCFLGNQNRSKTAMLGFVNKLRSFEFYQERHSPFSHFRKSSALLRTSIVVCVIFVTKHNFSQTNRFPFKLLHSVSSFARAKSSHTHFSITSLFPSGAAHDTDELPRDLTHSTKICPKGPGLCEI